MVAYCCVTGCNNNSRLKKDDRNSVTFHAFPTNAESKLKWLLAIGRPDWKPPIHARVCSAHFHVDDFNSDRSRKRMKCDAYPVLALPPNSNFDASDIEVCRFCLATDVKMYGLSGGMLKTCMESIAGLNENQIAGLPQFACYECAAGLYKCYKLIGKSMIAQATLLDIYAKHGQVTKSIINKQNRRQLHLTSSLSNHRLTDDFELKYNDLHSKSERLNVLVMDNINDSINLNFKYNIPDNNNDFSADYNVIANHPINKDVDIEGGVQETFVLDTDITEDKRNALEEILSRYNKDVDVLNESDVMFLDDDDDYKISSPVNVDNHEDVATELVGKKSKNVFVQDEDEIEEYFDVIQLSLEQQIDDWEKVHPKTETQKYKCDICYRTFVHINSLNNHMTYHDPSNGSAKCPVCHLRYLNEKRLKTHVSRSHARKYKCKGCPKSFCNVSLAKKHCRRHCGSEQWLPRANVEIASASATALAPASAAAACAHCGRTFLSPAGLKVHTNTTHRHIAELAPDSKYRCEKCELNFSSEGARRVHVLTSPQHKNDICETATDSLANTCRKCGEKFPSPEELRVHCRAEHPMPRKKRTWRMPDDNFPTQCEQCGETVNNRREHWAHWRRAHPSAVYRAVVTAVCHTCGKGFQSLTKLRMHMARHTGGSVPCEQCGRNCVDGGALKRHARGHRPRPTHQCVRCGRTFTHPHNLQRHARVHTSATPYECPICSKKFKHSPSVKLHIRTVHYKLPHPPRKKHTLKPATNAIDQQSLEANVDI